MDILSWLDKVVPQVFFYVDNLGGWFYPLCIFLFFMFLKFLGADDPPDNMPSGRMWASSSNREGVDVGHIDD